MIENSAGYGIILKLLLSSFVFFVVSASAGAVPSRDHTVLATLAGKCTKVTVMNVASDPNLCSDKVTNIRLGNGQSGYAFVLHPQGGLGPFVMSFVGKSPRQDSRHRGAQVLPVHRVYVTFDGRTDDLVAIGSCELSGPPKKKKTPTKVSCTANTIEGNFAGEFVGAGRSVSPSTTLTDRQFGRRVITHIFVCGQPRLDADGRRHPDSEDCPATGRR
jgi:hypothetical protein